MWGRGDSFVGEVLTLPASGKVKVKPAGAGPDGWLIVDVAMIDTGNVHVTNTRTAVMSPDELNTAASAIGRELRDTQFRVLAALVDAGRAGLIDHEYQARIDMKQTSAGVRRGELVKLGLAEYAGEYRQVDGGKGSRAKVWRVTPRGQLVWQLERTRRIK